jgi:ComF family protein
VRTELASRITGAAMAALLPARCPGCGRSGEPVCARCRGGLRPAPHLVVPVGLDAWVAPFAYEGVARELVARVKYRNERAVLPWLADAMVAALAAARLAPVPPVVVTWAPASAGHRRARGFDHGELLARAVARRTGQDAARLLQRAPGPPQTGRPRADRRPGPPLVPTAAANGVRSVLLVDDVVTTGATLAAAAACLHHAGVDRVVAVTAAATPPPGR